MDPIALQDFIGEAIALAGVAFVWIQTSRARQKERTDTAETRRKEGEIRAEERGELKQWRRSVDGRLDSHGEEYEALKAQIATDHRGLRERVDTGFDDTDSMLTGVRDMVIDMRGELHGAGILGKKG